MSRAPRDRDSVVVDVLIWIAIVNSLLVLLFGALGAFDVLAQKRSGHGEEQRSDSATDHDVGSISQFQKLGSHSRQRAEQHRQWHPEAGQLVFAHDMNFRGGVGLSTIAGGGAAASCAPKGCDPFSSLSLTRRAKGRLRQSPAHFVAGANRPATARAPAARGVVHGRARRLLSADYDQWSRNLRAVHASPARVAASFPPPSPRAVSARSGNVA